MMAWHGHENDVVLRVAQNSSLPRRPNHYSLRTSHHTVFTPAFSSSVSPIYQHQRIRLPF